MYLYLFHLAEQNTIYEQAHKEKMVTINEKAVFFVSNHMVDTIAMHIYKRREV
jgi:SAM-dependent MidA family methyltransferase